MSRSPQSSKLAAFPKLESREEASPHPDYAASFRCISSACEDNCCNGWTIPIDRRTVRAYQAHPTLAPFAQLLILNTENPSSGDYARMPLTHSGNCAFLSPEKLCAIHQHFGPDLLSVACNTFPRETSYQFGQPETALNLSCPEAARHTLLDPSLLDSWRALPLGEHLAPGRDPARAIRDFLLRLLLERTQPLAHRLALMGELCQQIPSFAWAQDHRAEVANLLQQTAKLAVQPAPRSNPRRQRELEFVTSVLAARVAAPPVPARFQQCLSEFMAGLFPAGDATAPVIISSPSSFLNQRPHLLENYLANLIFKYSYPFGHSGEQAPEEAHLYLAGLHSLVHTMLLGTAAYHRDELNTTHVIKLIQSFSRAIEHQSVSREEIVRRARAYHIGLPSAIHLVSVRMTSKPRPLGAPVVLPIKSRKLAVCQTID